MGWRVHKCCLILINEHHLVTSKIKMTVVQQFKAVCFRCGQGINNVCRFKGKPYGTECILHVTDNQELINHIRSLRRGRAWSLDADAWLKEQKDQARQQEETRINRKQKLQSVAEDNAWLINVLQDQLDSCFIKTIQGIKIYSKNMTFIESVVSDLQSRLFVEMSDKAKDCLIEIYAKSFGRQNSKAYDKAFDEAYNKAYPGDPD